MNLTSIVIPVYNEGEALVPYLEAVLASTTGHREVLVVHDMSEDSTVPVVSRYEKLGEPVRAVLNTYGPGPAHAIRYGIDASAGDAVVVTMADGSDDATQIDLMADKVRSGFVIVAASRYMRGGRQLGGPVVKRTLSRLAGLSLGVFGRVGTMDATSSFKAYDPEFVRDAGIESTQGFEIAIELVAKARRMRRPVTEIPTTWHDRTEGRSRFRTAAWIPHYLKWYFFAFGPAMREEPHVRATS